jgi:hypothetical protein
MAAWLSDPVAPVCILRERLTPRRRDDRMVRMVFAVALAACLGGCVDPLGFFKPSHADPELLGSTRAKPFALAVDDTHLYAVSWHGGERQAYIERVALAGGSPQLLATDQGAPGAGQKAALVAGGSLYWTTESVLMRVPVAGGEPQRVAAYGGYSPLAADASHVYFFGGFDRGLYRMAIAGDEPELLIEGIGGAVLAVDAEAVYWGAGRVVGGEIHRAAKTSGDWTPTQVTPYKTNFFFLDDDAIYLCGSDPTAAPGPSLLYRVAKEGGAPERVGGDCGGETGVLVDGVPYWSRNSGGSGAQGGLFGAGAAGTITTGQGRAYKRLFEGQWVVGPIFANGYLYFAGSGPDLPRAALWRLPLDPEA